MLELRTARLRVQRSQREIVHGYFGLDHQFDRFEIIRAGLGLRPADSTLRRTRPQRSSS